MDSKEIAPWVRAVFSDDAQAKNAAAIPAAKALLRQIHLLQESHIPQVPLELLQRCLTFDGTEIRILLRIRAFQPFERVI